jgi:hypothetical protein
VLRLCEDGERVPLRLDRPVNAHGVRDLEPDAEHGTPVSAQTVLTHLHDDDRTALSTAPGMERKAGEKLDLRELRKGNYRTFLGSSTGNRYLKKKIDV